ANVNITYPNGSIQQLALSNASTHATKYNLSYTIPGAIGLYSLRFIVNDSSNSVNSSETTNFTVNDIVAPNVTGVLPSAGTQFNISNFTEISANVTDDVAVSVVLANVTFPNSSNHFVTLSRATGSKYNVSFAFSLDGQYNFTIIANDTSNNLNGTQATNVNYTQDSDADGVADSWDTLRGNATHVVTSGVSNLNVTVAGGSVQGTFTDNQEVIFYDGTTSLLNFTHNFSVSTLVLRNISITVTTTSIVVNTSNQLAASELKTVYLADNSFIELCVKDQEIASASAISSSCTGTNETDFSDCLGSSVVRSNISCTDMGSRIRIENLTYSGVLGTQPSPPPDNPGPEGGESGGGISGGETGGTGGSGSSGEGGTGFSEGGYSSTTPPTSQELSLIKQYFAAAAPRVMKLKKGTTEGTFEAPTLGDTTQNSEAFEAQPTREVLISFINQWDRPMYNIEVIATSEAEEHLPIYPVKFIAPRLGGFASTRVEVGSNTLTASLAEQVKIDKLDPGEVFQRIVTLNLPFTAKADSVAVYFVYTTFDMEINRQKVNFSVTPKIFASAVVVNETEHVMEIVLAISNPEILEPEIGTHQTESDARGITGSVVAAEHFGSQDEDLLLEIAMTKEQLSTYKPSLGLIGLFEAILHGPKDTWSELLGPYPVKPGERFLLAQQFAYPETLSGEHDLEFAYRSGDRTIARQKHHLSFKRDCARDDDCS
ncbi:hypothetical protein HY497_02485, partial [Candidatus Woesearchaeota archaeon]|nr:hypothetical protein [Candidatus Woesearchaeota archaeon]